MGAIFGLLGGGFFKYLGAFVLVAVLLILLFSLIGGISYNYDTSDRSWSWQINFHFGEAIQNLREMRQNREWRPFFKRRNPKDAPEKEDEAPKFDIPDSGKLFPRFRPFLRLRERMRTEPKIAGHY